MSAPATAAPPGASLPKKPAGARNAKRACQFCKVRHLRCNGKEPCVHCEHRRGECVYLDTQPEKKKSANNTSNKVVTAGSQNFIAEPPTKRVKLENLAEGPPPIQTLHQTPQQQLGYQLPPQPRQPMPNPTQSGDGYAAGYYDQNGMMHYNMQHYPPANMPPANFQPMPRYTQPLHFHHPNQHMMNPMQYQQHARMQQQQQQPDPRNNQTPQGAAPPLNAPASTGVPKLSSSLLLSYARTVQPVTSTLPSSNDVATLQRLLQTEKHRLQQIDTATLVKAFAECAMVAHGSRYSGNGALAMKYGEKSIQILLMLMGTREKSPDFPPLAQSLVSGMELLTYFLVGSADYIRSRQVLLEAYRLGSIFSRYVTPATLHRIVGLSIAGLVNDVDVIFYIEKARKINLSVDVAVETSAYQVLSMALSGRFLIRNDLSAIKPDPPKPVDLQLKLLQMMQEVNLKYEECLQKFEQVSPPDMDVQALIHMYIGTLLASFCNYFWQMQRPLDALAAASKLIHMGRTKKVAPFPYMYSYCYGLKVARLMGKTDLFALGLSYFELDAPLYPYTILLLEELRRPLTDDEKHCAERYKDVAIPEYHSPLSKNQIQNATLPNATVVPQIKIQDPSGEIFGPDLSRSSTPENGLATPTPGSPINPGSPSMGSNSHVPPGDFHLDFLGPRTFGGQINQDSLGGGSSPIPSSPLFFPASSPGPNPSGSVNTAMLFSSPLGLNDLDTGPIFDPAPFWPSSM